MRTTLALDDELLEKAQAYTGLREIRVGPRGAQGSIERESARRLARWRQSSLIWCCRGGARSRVILIDTSIWVDPAACVRSERSLAVERTARPRVTAGPADVRNDVTRTCSLWSDLSA